MSFDAHPSKRVKSAALSDRSRAANFKKSGRPGGGRGHGRDGQTDEGRVRSVFRDGQRAGSEPAPASSRSHFVDHDSHGGRNHDGEHGDRPARRSRPEGSSHGSRFSRRREGNSSESRGERKMRSGLPRRKEISTDRPRNQPGFSTFQLRLVQSILNTTLAEGKPLDRSYAQWFAKVKIPAVEQGFIIKHINAMFRRLSFFAHAAGLKRPSDFQRHVNRLILTYCAFQEWPLPELNAEGFDRTGVKKRLIEAQEHPLLNEGCPYWLEELCSRELKELWPEQRKALGEAAPRYIRVNTLKTTRDELASRLSEEGVVTRAVKNISTALEVTSNAALFRTLAFREGLFEQQDAGSQLIAPFLDVQPGMRVIDTCAGSGGKTLHLAALMQNKGSLIALDIEGWKLDDLKKRARRDGVFNIDTRTIDSTKVVKRLYGMADRVLIDAPCSGLGVLRRTADSKWADVQPRLIELKKVQADILERYSRMVKPGGKLVYSTCSILPSENQEQIKAFLARHEDSFVLEEDQTIWPSSGFDGFYMARLRRLDTAALPSDEDGQSDDSADESLLKSLSSATGAQDADAVASDATPACAPADAADAAPAEAGTADGDAAARQAQDSTRQDHDSAGQASDSTEQQ